MTAKKRKRKRKFPDPSILLCPNIPGPLVRLNPRTIVGQTWWDKKRKEAYARFDRKCWACGTRHPESDGLVGHEVYDYDYGKGSAKLREIVALCRDCHNFIHDEFVDDHISGSAAEARRSRARHARVKERRVRILEENNLFGKWLHKDDAYWNSMADDMVDYLVKGILARVDLPKKTLKKLVEESVVRLLPGTYWWGAPLKVRTFEKDLPRKVARKLVEAKMGLLMGNSPRESPMQRALVGVPRELVWSFVRKYRNRWHLVVRGRKYRHEPGYLLTIEPGVYYRGGLDRGISGKVVYRGANVPSSPLRVKIIHRLSNRLVRCETYMRVGKRKLEDGFCYSVRCAQDLKLDDEYLVRAVKKASGGYLRGQVSVLGGRILTGVRIELLGPKSHRKKGRKKTESKMKKRIKR